MTRVRQLSEQACAEFMHHVLQTQLVMHSETRLQSSWLTQSKRSRLSSLTVGLGSSRSGPGRPALGYVCRGSFLATRGSLQFACRAGCCL